MGLCLSVPRWAEDAWGGTELVDARHRLSQRDDRRDRAIRWVARSEGRRIRIGFGAELGQAACREYSLISPCTRVRPA